MELSLWPKVCAKISDFFKKPKISESELFSNSKKKNGYRSVKEIEDYIFVLLRFYSVIGFISIVTIFYAGWPTRYPIVRSPKIEKRYIPNLYTFPSSCSINPFGLYGENFLFDFHALLRENETSFDHENDLIWTKSKLTYGDFQSAYRFSTNVSISEVSANSFEKQLHLFVILDIKSLSLSTS